MFKILRFVMVLMLAITLVPVPATPASAQAEPHPDANLCSQRGGTFTFDGEGSTICYWTPPLWNKDLVVFAHGYVEPRMEVGIPWDQLSLPDGASMPVIINKLGFAFAVTSYSKNGLAVKEGVSAVFRLVDVFKQANPLTRRVFLVGASEGGLVTTLALEKDAQFAQRTFSGGISACGPVGDFIKQVSYWNDFRLIFDYYFPGVIPVPPKVNNPAINIHPQAIAAWSTPQPQPEPAIPGPLQDAVIQALRGNPEAAQKLIAITRAPVDPTNLQKTIEDTTLGILGYNLLSTNEGRQELSGVPNVNLNTNRGSPYSNVGRIYTEPDGTLIEVATYRPDLRAVAEVYQNYTTSGTIKAPLVGMHTIGDPIIPYWHEPLYHMKTFQAGNAGRFMYIPINRYGHCNFKVSEAIYAFVVMVFRATFDRLILSQAVAALPDEPAQQEFQALVDANPELFQIQLFIPIVQH